MIYIGLSVKNGVAQFYIILFEFLQKWNIFLTICTFVIKIMLKIVSVTVVDGTLLNPSSNSSYSQPGVYGQKIRSVSQIQSKRSVDPCMLHGRLSIMGAPLNRVSVLLEFSNFSEFLLK